MKKIVCFDVDGTLVPNIPYSWEEFHRVFNIDRKILDAYLKDYFNGNITFEEWGILDTALWQKKNLKKSDFINVIKQNFHLAEGTIELLNILKKRQYILAVISGSLSIVPETLIPDFHSFFAYVYIGHLVFDNQDHIAEFKSGNLLKDGREHKLGELEEICKKENVPLSHTVFIGDHNNDISALKGAGLGIAFNPRNQNVEAAADVIINDNNLMKILDYL